jgi:DNA-directed RNA polymerase subunit beta
MEPKDREKQVFVANLMPARGSWLELEIDKKGKVFVRIDRKRKLPVTVLLRAMGYATDEEILSSSTNSLYIRNTIDADPEVTRSRRARSSSCSRSSARASRRRRQREDLLHQLFFDPKRYDLTRVGRYKLNSRLGLDIDLDTRTLTHEDIIALVSELVSLPKRLGIPEDEARDQGLRRGGVACPREPVADHLDEYEHFGNRRLRTVGELIQEAFRVGLYRMERVVRERLTTEDAGHDHAADDREHPPGRGRAEGVLRLLAAVAVHGPDELARRPHAPAAASALGAGGLTRERAPDRGARRPPDALRPHVPDRDAGGPEHRPDRLAVELRRGLRARLRHHALPRGQGRHVTDEIVHLDATRGAGAAASRRPTTPLDEKTGKLQGRVLCRTQAGQYVTVSPRTST